MEDHLWDCRFVDVQEHQKPHMLLVEISGGTEGTSRENVDSDLLRLAQGMKSHLLRVARSVRGLDIAACRKLRVVGVQVVGKYNYPSLVTTVTVSACDK